MAPGNARGHRLQDAHDLTAAALRLALEVRGHLTGNGRIDQTATPAPGETLGRTSMIHSEFLPEFPLTFRGALQSALIGFGREKRAWVPTDSTGASCGLSKNK